MPVQDNSDQRKTTEPSVDAEEELRRKTATAQEHQNEPSEKGSGKLLPFLNAKANRHESRIETIEGKIATQQDKISKHKAKIEQLSAKADKLEDTNRMLKATLGGFSLVQKMIQANERRIEEIRNDKIPNRLQKITDLESKVETLTAKRDRVSNKLNRVLALNDTIKSFGIRFGKERREVFADAMSRLNGATCDCLQDKVNAMKSQLADLTHKYEIPETSTVDKYRLQRKITDVNERIASLESKITKIARPETHYAEQTNDELDAAMKLTSDRLGEMAQNGTYSMPDLSEEAVTAAQRVEELDKAQIAALADELGVSPLGKAEEQIEDDYNMIDGIINNGSKEDIEKAKSDIAEGIKSMESLADNPFVSEEVRASAAEELAKMKSQLDLLNMHDEVEVESWLTDMLDKGEAVLTDDGGFKVNPDYYKELPRNDRHVETMTEAQAVEVMSALTAAGVQFSAATKGEDKVGITVSKNDVLSLNDVMYASIGKIAHTEAAKENSGKVEKGKYETVNPEYYASLSKEQRHTRVEPIDTARKIAGELQKQNIPYSAVIRQNDTAAITVSKENASAYKQISDFVNQAKATHRVNSGFFKQSPQQERPPQRQTKQTPKKKDGKRAYFTRNMMHKEAQRVKQGKPTLERPPSRKRNDQGLD